MSATRTPVALSSGARTQMSGVIAAAEENQLPVFFQLAADKHWSLRELLRVGMTLEEVFMRVVAGEEPAGAETAPPPVIEPDTEKTP